MGDETVVVVGQAGAVPDYQWERSAI